jgi:stage V sporulation protein AC
MSNNEYNDYVKKRSPASPMGKNVLRAFLIGGLICCIGQALLNGYDMLGLSEENAATAASITLIFIGALLTGLGVYDKLAKIAGAGTLVPITGFANSVAAPALEFKAEGFVTGMAVKMFSIAGPVIVFGTAAGVVYGLVLWVLSII